MKQPVTSFYIVRHGQSTGNKLNLIQGHLDYELTETGKDQAKKLAAALDKIHFDAVFSSDLLRAKQTAELLALEKKLIIETTEQLRERNFGRYQGQDRDEIHRMFSEWKAVAEEENWTHRFIDEETPEEMIIRFFTFLRELSVTFPGKTLLIVCHAGLIRTTLIKLGFWEWGKVGKVDNCSYLHLVSDGIDFFIKETEGIHPYEQK